MQLCRWRSNMEYMVISPDFTVCVCVCASDTLQKIIVSLIHVLRGREVLVYLLLCMK